MSPKAFKVTQDEVSCENFNFCAGQQSITVRRLEELRQQFPKSQTSEQMQELQEPTETQASSGPIDYPALNTAPTELVEQLYHLQRPSTGQAFARDDCNGVTRHY